MADYKPSAPFSTPLKLLIPEYTKTGGVRGKTYAEATNDPLFFGSFKTYGGTERDINGIYSVEDTANIETWYRPDIKSGCAVELAETGEQYEILGSPENINMRNQYLKFKVKRIKGGA